PRYSAVLLQRIGPEPCGDLLRQREHDPRIEPVEAAGGGFLGRVLGRSLHRCGPCRLEKAEAGRLSEARARILRAMGRVLLKVAAGGAAVIALLWVLSVIVGLLVWVVMIGLVIGVVYLGVRMMRAESGRGR